MRLALAASLLLIYAGCAATGGTMNDFANQTVDFGIVVTDINQSLAFYTGAVGLKEAGGFDVSAEMGGKAGLSDHKPFHVHVLKTTDADDATSVKLMQFPGTSSAKPDNTFIHSTVGIRYLTFYVADMDAALRRAAKAGVKPIAQGPYRLPNGSGGDTYLSVLRDPDGNMIEFVGPRKGDR